MADRGIDIVSFEEAPNRAVQIEALVSSLANLAMADGIDPAARTALLGASQQASLAATRQRDAGLGLETLVLDSADLAPVKGEEDLLVPEVMVLEVGAREISRPARTTVARTILTSTLSPPSVLSSPATRPPKTSRSRQAPAAPKVELVEGEVGVVDNIVFLGKRKIITPLATTSLLKTLAKLGGSTDLPTLLAEMNSGQRQHTQAEVERLLEIIQDSFVDNGCHEAWVDKEADGIRTIRIVGFKSLNTQRQS